MKQCGSSGLSKSLETTQIGAVRFDKPVDLGFDVSSQRYTFIVCSFPLGIVRVAVGGTDRDRLLLKISCKCIMDYNHQMLHERHRIRANEKCRIPLSKTYFHAYFEQRPIGECGVYIIYMRSNIRSILEDSTYTNMLWTKFHPIIAFTSQFILYHLLVL